jgi:hypothetical protein
MLNKVTLAKETAGRFAQQAGTATTTPSIKTAGVVAGVRQLGRK